MFSKIKESLEKLLNYMRKFSKVAGYAINMQKSIVYLYTVVVKYNSGFHINISFIITTEKCNL